MQVGMQCDGGSEVASTKGAIHADPWLSCLLFAGPRALALRSLAGVGFGSAGLCLNRLPAECYLSEWGREDDWNRESDERHFRDSKCRQPLEGYT